MTEHGLEFEQFDIDGRYIVRGLMIHNYAREVGATDDESFQALLDFHKVERVTGDVGGGQAGPRRSGRADDGGAEQRWELTEVRA